MISHAQYAARVFQYASADTEAHIAETVLQPLGLATAADPESARAYLSLFASPPVTTNFRFTGSQVAQAAADTCSACSAAHGRYTVDAMSAASLPYCLCVRPAAGRVAEWPSSLAMSGEAFVGEPQTPQAAVPAVGVVVVVDVGCAEAVLRGADVFAPGIYSSTGFYAAGQRVLVGFYMERTSASPRQQQSPAEHNGEPKTGSEVAYRYKFSTGHPIPPTVLVRPDKEDNLADRHELLVIIGEGVATMDRTAVHARGQRGVAVKMDLWTPLMQPSMETLERLAQPQAVGPALSPTALLLQNYSSMVPVQLLTDRMPSARRGGRPLMLLDACAAPGGKTSLLLSLMKDKHKQWAHGTSDWGFRLVCCERSAPRHKNLVSLLSSHFPSTATEPDFLQQTLCALAVDVNKLPAALAKADPAAPALFDGILLDPPCTGMGLRPRLLPHAFTRQNIADHADYQRALFRSCLRFLRGPTEAAATSSSSPAILAYSTCTITLEENEANVLHFLESYPQLRLARARTPAEVALCELSSTTGRKDGKRFLLHDDIMRVQEARERLSETEEGNGRRRGDSPITLPPVLVLRFMPTLDGAARLALDDTVGFFVAVFEYGAWGCLAT